MVIAKGGVPRKRLRGYERAKYPYRHARLATSYDVVSIRDRVCVHRSLFVTFSREEAA